MEPLHETGWHCFHDCVLSVAYKMGVDYRAAFASLWSEGDFYLDTHNAVYLSRRLFDHLEALGARFTCHRALTRENVLILMDGLGEDDYFIIGMDAFYIPWSNLHGIMHGPHFFIAQNEIGDTLPCCDPTYGIRCERITRHGVLEHAFDLCIAETTTAQPHRRNVRNEAWAVLRTHPHTLDALIGRVQSLQDNNEHDFLLLGRYTDALITNRRMFHSYLITYPPFRNASDAFLSTEDYSRWNAVKNGLFIAAKRRDHARILDDVMAGLGGLMREEAGMAENMLAMPADDVI